MQGDQEWGEEGEIQGRCGGEFGRTGSKQAAPNGKGTTGCDDIEIGTLSARRSSRYDAMGVT